MKPETRILICEDLDPILPDYLLTSNDYVIMYISNKDGVEKIIAGWHIAVYFNNKYIEKCIKCKNGKNGWIEYIGEDLELKKEKGDVKVYLCVPFEEGEKPPQVDIIISDFKSKNCNIKEYIL